MNVILFDTEEDHKNLQPLTLTRPVSDIRCGILTLREKWAKHTNVAGVLAQDYLHPLFAPVTSGNAFLYVRSSVVASKELLNELQKLKDNELLVDGKEWIGFKSNHAVRSCNEIGNKPKGLTNKQTKNKVSFVHHLWDIFVMNGECIKNDFKLLTAGKKTVRLSSTNRVIGKKNQVFLEKGAIAEACIFNTNDGPVYIGKKAEVMEGTLIRGPFALGEESTLKMGAKIYGATTIGPHCKVGGEVSNSVIFGYSNKAHDGFLGNSVIGEWCNLGADTNNSNLKNNYGNVKITDIRTKSTIDTNRQFCGVFMGDHSKTGINTMLNTGTVIGVSANIFGGDFPPKLVPSFSWGGANGFEKFDFTKALEVAKRVKERRGLSVEPGEEKILKYIFGL
ncbi:MAG: GlmU family protein [Flavobacteriales bacterium]